MTKTSDDMLATNDEDDVHSARTVPPPAGGDAYGDATVVREVPADILAAIELPEEKLSALTTRAPRPVAPPSRAFTTNAEGLPSVVVEDEDEDEDAPASSPLLQPPEVASVATPQVAHDDAGAPASRSLVSRYGLIGLMFAAALVIWTLAALK